MSWTLSVSARKADLSEALDRAEAVHKGDLHPDAEKQVEAVKALVRAALPTYEHDDGMVGLYATGGGGTGAGLLSVSLSVASETIPPEPETAPEPELVGARQAAGSRYAPGERPEAPGTIDDGAVARQAEAEADDPRRAAYRPDEEPTEPATPHTSLGEDNKRAADARAEARKPAARK